MIFTFYYIILLCNIVWYHEASYMSLICVLNFKFNNKVFFIDFDINKYFKNDYYVFKNVTFYFLMPSKEKNIKTSYCNIFQNNITKTIWKIFFTKRFLTIFFFSKQKKTFKMWSNNLLFFISQSFCFSNNKYFNNFESYTYYFLTCLQLRIQKSFKEGNEFSKIKLLFFLFNLYWRLIICIISPV